MLTLVWGTNWPLFALATREVSVWTFRAVAVLVASLFLLGVARLRGQSLVLPRRHWLRMGIATSLYLVLWNIASTYAALMSWLLLGERPTARMAVKVPATVLTGWQLLITAVPPTIGALCLGDGAWFMPSATSVLVIAYIALVPMSIGNVAWFAIVGLLPASVAGLSAILVPMVAMISGALIHGEPLGAVQQAAMACCAAALRLALTPAGSRS